MILKVYYRCKHNSKKIIIMIIKVTQIKINRTIILIIKH